MTHQRMLENESPSHLSFSDQMGGSSDSLPKIIDAYSLLPNQRGNRIVSSNSLPKIESIFSLHYDSNSGKVQNSPSGITKNNNLIKTPEEPSPSPDLVSIDQLVHLKPLPEGSHLSLNDAKVQGNGASLQDCKETFSPSSSTKILASNNLQPLRNGVTLSCSKMPTSSSKITQKNLIKANYFSILSSANVAYVKNYTPILKASLNGSSLDKPGNPPSEPLTRTQASLPNRPLPFITSPCQNLAKSQNSKKNNPSPQDHFSLLRTLGSQGSIKPVSTKVNDLTAHVKAQLNRHLNYQMRHVQPSPSSYYLATARPSYPMEANPYSGQQINYSPHQDTSYYNFLKNFYYQKYGSYSEGPEVYPNSKSWQPHYAYNSQAISPLPNYLFPNKHRLKELFHKMDEDFLYLEPEVILEEFDGPVIVPGLATTPLSPDYLRSCKVVLQRLTEEEIELYTKMKQQKILDVIVIDDDDDNALIQASQPSTNLTPLETLSIPSSHPVQTHQELEVKDCDPISENISNLTKMPTLLSLLASNSKAIASDNVPEKCKIECSTDEDVQIITPPENIPATSATNLLPLKPFRKPPSKKSRPQKRSSPHVHLTSPAKKALVADPKITLTSHPKNNQKPFSFSGDKAIKDLEFLIKPCSVVLERIPFL